MSAFIGIIMMLVIGASVLHSAAPQPAALQTPTESPQEQRSAPPRYPSKAQLARSVGPGVQDGVSIGLVRGLQADSAPESRISQPSDPAALQPASAWRA